MDSIKCNCSNKNCGCNESTNCCSSSSSTSYLPKAIIGRRAPDFAGTAWHGKIFKDIKLADYKGKWVVLFFYPMDFTFVCPTEICQFSDHGEKFQSLNCEVIGCSVDSKFSHREYALKPREEGGLSPLAIPLLSDISHEISKDYGVLIDQGPDKGVAFRGTFIIDPTGILRQYSINDLAVGRNIEEVIRLLQGFQFNEKYGEVCPSKWKPGDKTMVTDLESDKTKQYFKEEMAKK